MCAQLYSTQLRETMDETELDALWNRFLRQHQETWEERLLQEAYADYAEMALSPDGIEALRREWNELVTDVEEAGDLRAEARAAFERAVESQGTKLTTTKDGELFFQPSPIGSDGHAAACRAEERIMEGMRLEAREHALDEIRVLRETWGAWSLLEEHLPSLLPEKYGEMGGDSGESGKGDEEPISVTGYHAPQYVEEARRVMEATTISSFSALAAEMGTRGDSKVDTVKRGLGYKDLPKSEKSFSRFRKMLERADL